MATQSGAITSLLLSQYPRGRAETPPQQRFALRSASQEWVEEPAVLRQKLTEADGSKQKQLFMLYLKNRP